MSNIEQYILKEIKDVKPKEKEIIECESCGKRIKNNKWNKEHLHINICQEPIKRFFCSRECKLKWVFKQ